MENKRLSNKTRYCEIKNNENGDFVVIYGRKNCRLPLISKGYKNYDDAKDFTDYFLDVKSLYERTPVQ